jgi:tricorn protease
VLWPGISADGKAIVFERDFHLWKLDPANGHAAPVEISLRGVPSGPSATHLTLNNEFRDLALSADGKKVAFTAHGEVFAASAKDGGSGARLTNTAANESEIGWSPDGKQVVYVSDRDGPAHLFLYDIGLERETKLTSAARKDEKPQWSPDGKQIAWIRDGREVHVMTLADKVTRVIASHKYRTLTDAARPLSWSPDGQWIAFFSIDSRGFANVAVAPSAGGPERSISFIANSEAGGITWSPDRTYLLSEQHSISRIDLVPRTPKFREDQFRDLFREETPVSTGVAAGGTTGNGTQPNGHGKMNAPVEITFEGIRNRLTRLPLGLDAGSQTISPDGKTLLFIATTGGQENLYTYSLDELATQPAVPRQLTSTAGRKSYAQFSPDSKEVFYLDAGRINVIPVETRTVRALAVTVELDVDFEQEKHEVFQQAWSTLNEIYYDPKFHGADWKAMRERYAPAIDAARTPDEVRRVISLMIGELNSSHSGINGGPAATRPSVTGRLGMVVNPADSAITAVTPLGPADVEGIKTGDKLLSIDGVEVTPSTSIDELLQYKIGKRTVISTSSKKNLAILPINTATEKRLLYREWVEGRRAYVDKLSGGKLGYVHMLDMSSTSLDQLYLDLDSENQSREGVVIDIRNNTGGFVNAYALDVFARRPYLSMTERDHPTTPARSALGQRSLELPTVLVVNQNSLSDAEDFTEGYRTLKLGKVVGVPTAGWIIYTGGVTLVDGSALRTPEVRISASDGTDMELHPRPVDVRVESPIGESLTGHDAQLETAVKTLLGEISGK